MATSSPASARDYLRRFREARLADAGDDEPFAEIIGPGVARVPLRAHAQDGVGVGYPSLTTPEREIPTHPRPSPVESSNRAHIRVDAALLRSRYGVRTAERLVTECGLPAISRAIEVLESTDPATVKSPAGLLVWLARDEAKREPARLAPAQRRRVS